MLERASISPVNELNYVTVTYNFIDSLYVQKGIRSNREVVVKVKEVMSSIPDGKVEQLYFV